MSSSSSLSDKGVKMRTLDVRGPVGFDTLPDQVMNKSAQKGFTFNILCLGETGVGKSTLINSLFNTDLDAVPCGHQVPSVKLKSQTYELQEKNVQLDLTVIETLGYGDQINKEDSFDVIVDHVDQQLEAYLQEELRVDRCFPAYHDTRVHVCLYFICPTGHGLKSLDLVCMKKLDSKVNIIPLIAKADAMSKDDLTKLKEKIMSELRDNGVKIYQFPTDDETEAKQNSAMNSLVPFAVVGSNEFVKVGNKEIRARQYPWGAVEVENENHNDFVKLRETLIRTNMDDLKETTHSTHYEFYRKMRLQQMGFSDVELDLGHCPMTFQQTCERMILLHKETMASKEKEIKQSLRERSEEKEIEFQKQEDEIRTKANQTMEESEKERRRLEASMKQLDADIIEFQQLKARRENSLSANAHHTLSLSSLMGRRGSKVKE